MNELKKQKTEIDNLEKYFNSIQIPEVPLTIDSCQTITNPSKFIKVNLSLARANVGKRHLTGAIDRLRKLKDILS